MPWFKVELNVGISDKLANYIVSTYGGGGQTIRVFEREGNYTKIIAFANSQAAINTALNDLRTRIAEVTEMPPDYNPGA